MSECPLTHKQIEIIRWLADGKEQVEIAEIMGSARNTITRHVSRAHQAVGTFNMHGLVAMSLRKGWIE